MHTMPGATYEGDFEDGVRHGYGKLAKKNGVWYEGEFRNGKKHWYGTQFFPENASKE